MSVPSANAPSYKQQRYDRQLRLWGDHGQQRLELASVCLVNATGTGTETIKNLVLPGIGAFTILDVDEVSGSDLEANFFVLREDGEDGVTGRKRADVVCESLLALNSEVRGKSHTNISLKQLLQDVEIDGGPSSAAEFFRNFALVIVCDPENEIVLHELSVVLWQLNVPLLVTHTIGMMGFVRLQVREHIVQESHPDYVLHDLRLDVPLQAFVDYADEFSLDKLSNKDHSHVPWLVLLYKALSVWRMSTQRDDFPTLYADKKAVKEVLIKHMQRSVDEENFREAEKAVNTAFRSSGIPEEVQLIFSDNKCHNLSVESDPFWIIMHAVKQFADENQQLPLSGVLPDMTSTTEWFVRLQHIYREKAVQDAANVFTKVTELAQKFHFVRSDHLTLDFVRYICKNAAYVRVVRTTPLFDELCRSDISCSELMSEELDAKNVQWYKTYRRFMSFMTENQRMPTALDSKSFDVRHISEKRRPSVEDDIREEPVLADEACWNELCRFGGETLYSMRAFVGGIAAQEAVKLITRQYVPMRDVIVCNGIDCSVSSFQIDCSEKNTVVIKR